jgi:hypothetical protein
MEFNHILPSGKLTQLWKITISMGKSTISMAIFNSKLLSLPEGFMGFIGVSWMVLFDHASPLGILGVAFG